MKDGPRLQVISDRQVTPWQVLTVRFSFKSISSNYLTCVCVCGGGGPVASFKVNFNSSRFQGDQTYIFKRGEGRQTFFSNGVRSKSVNAQHFR